MFGALKKPVVGPWSVQLGCIKKNVVTSVFFSATIWSWRTGLGGRAYWACFWPLICKVPTCANGFAIEILRCEVCLNRETKNIHELYILYKMA